jgi:hypothetical protein
MVSSQGMIIKCSSEKMVTTYKIIRCHDPEDRNPELFSILEGPWLLIRGYRTEAKYVLQ